MVLFEADIYSGKIRIHGHLIQNVSDLRVENARGILSCVTNVNRASPGESHLIDLFIPMYNISYLMLNRTWSHVLLRSKAH